MAALFGARVRRLRTAAGLTQAELGALTHVVSTRITQIERASGAKPTLELARALDAVLGADDLLVELWPYVYREAFPDWSRKFMEYSERAVAVRQYAAHVVPGLLQTEDYARAVFTMRRPLLDEVTIEQRVEARLARQEVFARKPAPTMSFVMEEAVVRKRLGGSTVWRGQLEQILLVGERRNVQIQLMPDDREEHAALAGPFSLIETENGRRIAYMEAHKHSRLFADRATVRELEEQYSLLRAQALTPRESLALVEKLLGET